MDARILTTKLEAAVERQLLMAGGQPEIEAAAAALLGVLEPALREAALELAGQAAAEVAAQLPGHQVDVVVVDGEPELRVRSEGDESAATGSSEPLDARITLRLPPQLKELIESSALERGESVNSWLVRSLSGVTIRASRGPGLKISGRIQT
jgi:predicted HicB family RNase H-like nuclease